MKELKTIYPFGRCALLVAILLLALALRLAPWGHNRFLEDEALYAYWGLQIATNADPMLDLEPLDKPPLYPYVLALSFRLLGQNETAARLPSLLASVTGIALVYALGRELYRDARVGLVAALLLALSPFDILFASTAFTDPLMTALVLGSLLAAAKGRLGAAGMLSALAAAAKQQGLFFLPLVVAVGLLARRRWPAHSRSVRASDPAGGQGPVAGDVGFRSLKSWAKGFIRLWKSRWVRFALGFLVVAAGVIWWDLARVQRPGFFEQSLISYGGLGPARPEALIRRAVEWLRLAGAFWISPWFYGLLAGCVLLWLVGGFMGWWAGCRTLDLVLGGFIACFLGLHWLLGFQVWDRYLLGLIPLVALLAARAFVATGETIPSAPWRRIYAIGLGLALVTTLASPVLRAARSQLPLGGDHGAYDGIDDLASYMRAQAPPGAVLYHHWLGYHYRFYLRGAPLRLHWYPDLEDLAQDTTVYRREPRYIAFPSWRDSTPAAAALAEAGITLTPVFETVRRDGSVSFRLHRLEGP